MEPKRIKEKFKELNIDSDKDLSSKSLPSKKQKVDNNPENSKEIKHDSVSIFN